MTAREFETRRCRRCGHFWSTNAPEDSLIVTQFCPLCIPKMTHQLADAHVEGVHLTEDDRRSHARILNVMRARMNSRIVADTNRLRGRFPAKPHVRLARQYLRCSQDHAIRVLWYAYEMPRLERESA